MRKPPYADPGETNDFDDLSPDEAAKMLHSYRLLGDCFELSDDEEMFGRGWLIAGWRDLLEGHQERLLRVERELAAAVRLARNEGGSWDEIARVLGLPGGRGACTLRPATPEPGLEPGLGLIQRVPAAAAGDSGHRLARTGTYRCELRVGEWG